ncbi:MAG: Uma2 family endonuclease [Gemmataceae bacterium]|nr:Uma2 family endonuclease [Gemmataceae bacterium]
MTGILWTYTRQRKQGYVCPNDTGLLLQRGPDTVRGPDVVLFFQNRRHEDRDPRFTDRIPSLVVEVLSPNDKVGKTMRRISEFLARGVPLVWLIDPEDRSITVHRAHQLPLVLDENETVTGFDILPEFTCGVAEFFIMPADSV